MAASESEYTDDNNLRFREERNLTLSLEQNVSGKGYFASYSHSLMPDDLGTPGYLFNGVEAKNRAHGSGSFDMESKTWAESSHYYEEYFSAEYDEDGEPYEDDEDAISTIEMTEDSKMAHSPVKISAASPYYALHPIVIDSLLSEKDEVKNRDCLDSINHRIEAAHSLEKTVDIKLYYDSTTMNVDDNLTDGRVYIGALQLAGIPVDEEPEEEDSEEVLGLAMKNWKSPLSDLDEDYVGTFHIRTNITLGLLAEEEEKEEGWLPCCYEGWNDMLYYDSKYYGKSARGIFDCTCFNAAKQAVLSGRLS